jgi:hypothetical protein
MGKQRLRIAGWNLQRQIGNRMTFGAECYLPSPRASMTRWATSASFV